MGEKKTGSGLSPAAGFQTAARLSGPAVAPILSAIAAILTPVAHVLTPIAPVLTTVIDVFDAVTPAAVVPPVVPILEAIAHVLAPIADVLAPVATVLEPVAYILAAVVAPRVAVWVLMDDARVRAGRASTWGDGLPGRRTREAECQHGGESQDLETTHESSKYEQSARAHRAPRSFQ